MNTKITVTTKIVVNGKEYHSIEELPPDVRAKYEAALAARAQAHGTSRIVFNGQPYDSLEAMPADVRALYEAAMANLAKTSPTSPALPQDIGGPIEPAGVSRGFLTAVFIAAALLAFLYWMYRG